MSVLLQVVEAANSSESVTTPAIKEFSLLDVASKGGIIMIPIAILSIVAVYLIIERILYIRRAAKVNPHHIVSLQDKLKTGDVKGAVDMCKSTPTAWGRIFGKGSSFIGQKMEDIDKCVEDSTQLELSKMEKNMTYLNLIAGMAPLLGFIGTIMGVIKIFYEIASTGEFTIATISEGLYQKMVSSAAGLIVGIIAFAGYHMLNASIDRFTTKIRQNALSFKSTLLNIQE